MSGLSEDQIWQRPAKNEWCIGEILSHNHRVMASAIPYVRFVWRLFRWYGERFRARPYRSDIPDLYREGKFPMWTGFLWSPRHRPARPVPTDHLKAELRALHGAMRSFYEGKEENVLGNIAIYDPYFGRLNLIVTLRLGIHHDQLHFEDVIRLAAATKGG